jgi:heme/copper-type cytochrome/quinol oxidase subunit 3
MSGHAVQTSTGIPNKKLAMWAFLASDCMFFGTLISTHLIYRKIADNINIREIFDIELTSFSTFILLGSSLFMALAVSAAHKSSMQSMRKMLAGTIFFGLIFLACQVYEFYHFAVGLELTLSTFRGDYNLFGTTFYVLTGTHGVHVALGVFWLISWLIYSYTGKMKPENAEDVEVAGLYWHFVDVVWIIIFPVVYLIEYI